VVDLTLEQALPAVQDLARRKANAFVRRCGLGIDEREDIQSRLVLIFLIRWPQFDHERASIRTFASRVMDKELASILRYRLAEGRRPQDPPTQDLGPHPAALRHFRLDVERALAPLPAAIRATAVALSLSSTAEAADTLGCSRQMISRRKQQIRKAFLAAGIGPAYLVEGGCR
jgi:DNA-directed RNA polymerase specialized sigma24 family protein